MRFGMRHQLTKGKPYTMQQQHHRKVQHRTREHVARAQIDPQNPGRVIMLAPIQGRPGTHAVVYAEDYERVSQKNERRWFLKKAGRLEYVTIKHAKRGKNKEPSNHVTIAWIILGLWPKDSEEVTYLDEDRLNLRRDNLVVRPRESNPHVKAARARKRSQLVSDGAASQETK